MSILKNIAFVILAALSLLPTRSLTANDKIVATVNGVAITEDVLMAEVNKALPMASFHANVSKEKLREIRSRTLEKLIEDELLFQEAKRRNLTPIRSEVDKQVEIMKNGYPTEQLFLHQLAKAGLSPRQLQDMLERRLCIQMVEKLLIHEKIVVSESDLRNYYQKNTEKFVLPKQFHVGHILISVDPGAMAPGWKNGFEEAQKLYESIKSGGDFAREAMAHSADSTSRDQGGDLGWFHQGQFLHELEEALGEMKIGEISKPIRTIYGYHLLILRGEKPEKQLAFDQIDRDMLIKKMFKKRTEERRQQLLEELKAAAEIHIPADQDF